MARKIAKAPKLPRSGIAEWNRNLAIGLRRLRVQMENAAEAIRPNGQHLVAETYARDAAWAVLRGFAIDVREAEETALDIAAHTEGKASLLLEEVSRRK